jgi:transaldolase / glucose-6-phosphate isomerase
MQPSEGFDRLGPVEEVVRASVGDLVKREAVRRLWDGDSTLWQDDPTEVADRLGWLQSPVEMEEQRAAVDDFAAAVHHDGFRHAVLLGMGGSSLFPEVMARTFGAHHRHHKLDLRVLDTTDPTAIRRVERECDLDHTLFIAASKSGTTIETTTQLEWFWERAGGRGEQFIAITDPGTSLAEVGRERGFRAVFENRPDIGGRYSALSHFGLVPAALLGVDIAALLQSAADMATTIDSGVDPQQNFSVWLAAAMAGAANDGVDKLTLLLPEEVASFGLWVEQLVAESTGKDGTGIVPIVGEEAEMPEVYARDRLFVSLGWHPLNDALAEAGHPVVVLPFHEPYDLGGHVLLWESATALSGALLGINPFDQPNVAGAKEATARVLEDGLSDITPEPLDSLLGQVQPGDYLAILAFVDPGSAVVGQLQRARTALRNRLLVATTLGIGPRYLHSTGQLHKGGPPSGVFVQVVGDDEEDLPIPGKPFGFSTLKRAQAAGDLAALKDAGLRAGRVRLDELIGVDS